MRMVATFGCSCYCGNLCCTAVVFSSRCLYSRSFHGNILYDWYRHTRIKVDQTVV